MPAFLLNESEADNMEAQLRNTTAPPAIVRGCESYTLTSDQESHICSLQGFNRRRGKLLMAPEFLFSYDSAFDCKHASTDACSRIIDHKEVASDSAREVYVYGQVIQGRSMELPK